ncbi:MAG: glycosyltransferase [Gammaproteobacteria bacterium]|nr:glycosyltransferase [Gammaproteobacteria bacterium]
MSRARLSVVVPMFDEAENVAPMLECIHAALANCDVPWELIVIDDGSSDDTLARLTIARRRYGEHVRIIELERNFGQTAAMQAGIDAARGDVIAILDGDLQNDPGDIPRLVERLLREDLDLLVGWRRHRRDGLWLRRAPSRVANFLIGRLTGVRVHDYGCTLKVLRASVAKRVRLYGEMHRFIPTWIITVTSPRRIGEEVVNHRARSFGRSKYGITRTFRVLLDLLAMYFFLRFRARPGHFFGGVGIVLGTMGTSILAYLGYVKFLLGESIGTRPFRCVAADFVAVLDVVGACATAQSPGVPSTMSDVSVVVVRRGVRIFLVIGDSTTALLALRGDTVVFVNGIRCQTCDIALAGVCVAYVPMRYSRLLLVGVGSLVAFSRIAVGVHWPSDVLIGAAGGWVAAALGLVIARYWDYGIRPAGHRLMTRLWFVGAVAPSSALCTRTLAAVQHCRIGDGCLCFRFLVTTLDSMDRVGVTAPLASAGQNAREERIEVSI